MNATKPLCSGVVKKKCLIYANCQGSAVGSFLEKSAYFQEKYFIEIINNYIAIKNKIDIDLASFNDAELFIYQPINIKHGIYATDYIMKYLPAHCVKISFPYVYNYAMWPLFEDVNDVKGKDAIVSLVENDLSLKEIADKFCRGEIDFEFGRRFDETIAVLRSKENETDVKIVDFILGKLRTEKIFLTHNHHTNSLYIHCADQILNMLCFPALDFTSGIPQTEICLGECWPQSPYETNFYGLTYLSPWEKYHPEKKDSNWHRFYLRLIGKIYFSYPMPWIKKVWERIYLYLRIRWSLLVGAGYLRTVDREKIKGWRNGTRQKI